jgi:hypothetical protein
MIADLDTLLIALYCELTDCIIPRLGFTRSGPGKPPEVTDAELACLAVAQVLLRCWPTVAASHPARIFACPANRPNTSVSRPSGTG